MPFIIRYTNIVILIWIYITLQSTVLCKSFRPPRSFCLSHESWYLIQNGTNFNENFTCGRAKRYLSLVTFKKLIMQTGSSAITGSTGYNLSPNSKINYANWFFLLIFPRYSVAQWLQCFRNNKNLWCETLV